MAKTSGKLVTRGVLEQLREELRKRAKVPVPKPERYTRTQVAGELDAEIQELLKAGYGLSQIAGIFKEKGIEIGVATLRTRNRTQASGGTKGVPVERGGVKSERTDAVQAATTRIVATENAAKGVEPKSRFAVRPDTPQL